MGRELRRKQAKKEGKSLVKEEIIEERQIQRLIRTTIIIVVFLGLVYFLSAIFVTKEIKWFSKNKETTSNTVANSILASAIFKQAEDEYYVYLYDFNETDGTLTNIIGDSLYGLKVYKVDTTSAMNKKYVSEESNKKAKSLDDLQVIAPTVIKISGDTITEYYENDEIKSKFLS